MSLSSKYAAGSARRRWLAVFFRSVFRNDTNIRLIYAPEAWDIPADQAVDNTIQAAWIIATDRCKTKFFRLAAVSKVWQTGAKSTVSTW